jgi:hypothetical protein
VGVVPAPGQDHRFGHDVRELLGGHHGVVLPSRQHHRGARGRDETCHVGRADPEGPGVQRQAPAAVLLAQATGHDVVVRVAQPREAGDEQVPGRRLLAGVVPGHRPGREGGRLRQLVRGPHRLDAESDRARDADAEPPAGQHEADDAAEGVPQHDDRLVRGSSSATAAASEPKET